MTFVVVAICVFGVVLVAGQIALALRLRGAMRAMRRTASAEATATSDLVTATTAELVEANRRVVREVESIINIRSLVPARTTMPTTTGWAASPMTTEALVREILDHEPRTVVELGSGGSSIWAGYCLERNGGGQCVSLDHKDKYAEQTRAELRRHGLEKYVDVVSCPLVEQDVHGRTIKWYDLSDLRPFADPIDLIFVDGPPRHTGPMARFPAVPLLLDRCAPGAHLLLDDAGRPDEQEIIEAWTDEFGLTLLDSEGTHTGWSLFQLP